jgi:uncharacterized protein (TIGR02147 family)
MNPYDHRNWRDLVRAVMAERAMSQRDLAARLGMSTGNLSALMANRRRLSGAWGEALCRELGLRDEAAAWFLALVDLESTSDRARQAAEAVVRSRLGQLAAPARPPEVVDAQADWRVNALQELAACDGFRPEPAWMASMLDPAIEPGEAAELWERLLRTGLVAPRSDGRFEVASVRTESVLDAAQTHAGCRLQASVFGLVARGWERFAPNERHGGVATMALSEAGAARVIRRLRELEQELVQLALDDEGPKSRVYFLTTQLIPATDYTDSGE